jgi:hypothetical protein
MMGIATEAVPRVGRNQWPVVVRGFEPADATRWEAFAAANNPLHPRFRAMVALWRRLPRPVANAIGPMIVRNLG